jgi:hypothetical protein
MTPLPATITFAFWLHARLLGQFAFITHTPKHDPKKE